jgi:hypothetical protein
VSGTELGSAKEWASGRASESGEVKEWVWESVTE